MALSSRVASGRDLWEFELFWISAFSIREAELSWNFIFLCFDLGFSCCPWNNVRAQKWKEQLSLETQVRKPKQ